LELEDSLSKLLNFYNVLIIDEEISKDNLKNIALITDVVDILSSTVENEELILVNINFISIISF